MSMTIEPVSTSIPWQGSAAATASVRWPRLLEGTEPVGRRGGSGLRAPPYLVRRCDGEVVQLSQLLYAIASSLDGRPLPAIADSVERCLDVRIPPEQIAYVA